MKTSYELVDVDNIIVDEVLRHNFNTEAAQQLGYSIKNKGVLQSIIIEKKKDGRFYLIAGLRRLKAMKINSVPIVMALVVTEINEEQAIELSLIENIQREQLNPLDEALAFVKWLEPRGYPANKGSWLISDGIDELADRP